ncbi:hypothetical protein Tco_0767107, partial [Tanacetum coccineum]
SSPLANSISTRDMYRAGLNPFSKAQDIFLNNSWSWPQELIDKYPFLGSISMPNHTNRADLLEWRDENVWNYMKTYAGMSTSVPVFSSSLASLISIAKRKSSKSVIAKMVVTACAYYIRQERNWGLFKKNKRTAKQVIDCIMSCVSLKLLSCNFMKSNDGVLFSRLWNLPDSVFI